MYQPDIMEPWKPHEVAILEEIQGDSKYIEISELLKFISRMDQVESKIKKIVFQCEEDI